MDVLAQTRKATGSDQAGAGLAGADALGFLAARFFRFTYASRRWRFSTLLYCLPIANLYCKRYPLF
jgi:hypothetical protein